MSELESTQALASSEANTQFRESAKSMLYFVAACSLLFLAIFGQSIYENWSVINDRGRWNKASKAEQDQVIQEATKTLGPAYRWIETREYSCGGPSHRIATFQHVKSGLLLNLIPGGTFTMGESKKDRPAPRVTVKPFLIGRFEVRQSCWDKIGGTDERSFKGPDLPIASVSWEDVQAWLKKAGDGLRLPSESEWEYACRSGTMTDYYWGNNWNKSHCWYFRTCHINNEPKKVTDHFDTESWNAFGLVDMSGNVSEWCLGSPGKTFEYDTQNTVPLTFDHSKRMNRGGGWYAQRGRDLYTTTRHSSKTTTRSDTLGFRVVRGLD